MKRLFSLIVVLLLSGAVLAQEPTLKQQILERIESLRQLAEGLPDEPVPDPDDPVDPDPDDPVDPDPDDPVDPDPDDPVDPDPVDPDIPLGDPHMDAVPDFTADPDAIVIPEGDTLEIDSTVEFTTLVISTGATLNLLPGAELIIKDTPINTDLDPTQIGHGIINQGTWNYAGTPKTEFARSTTGIPAGAETITLDVAPEGWNVGDVLVIPDTRQHVIGTKPPTWTERVEVTAVDGVTVTITPTQHDHLVGTHDWMTPHVANVTRDIVIRSENPDGVRGHVIHMGKVKVNGSYAAFVGLGRTDATRLHNSTLFDADGNVTHLGTNQNGRYVNHFHMIRGYGQFVNLKGDVYDGSKKWCLAVHGTQGVTAERCIALDAVGGAFTTEDGSEEFNTWRECLAIGARNGLGGRRPQPLQTNTGLDIARDGSGFWFRNIGNHVIDCIAADCEERGFSFNGMSMPDEFKFPRKEHPGTFTRNEAYATREAYWLREHQGGVNNAQHSTYIRFPMSDCTAWSVEEVGVLLYRTAAVTIDNFRVYSDPRIGEQAKGKAELQFNNVLDSLSIGFVLGLADYASTSQVLVNSRCEGFSVGVHLAPRPWADMLGRHDSTIHVTSTVLSAGVPVVAPIVNNETPYILDDVMLDRIDMVAVPPLPEATDVWMNNTSGKRSWDVPVLHNIWINGERYWYSEEPGEGREEREGVVGLVSQE